MGTGHLHAGLMPTGQAIIFGASEDMSFVYVNIFEALSLLRLCRRQRRCSWLLCFRRFSFFLGTEVSIVLGEGTDAFSQRLFTEEAAPPGAHAVASVSPPPGFILDLKSGFFFSHLSLI